MTYHRSLAYGIDPRDYAGTTGLLALATIGCGIAMAQRAERATRMIAEGRWTDTNKWI